MRVPSEGSLRSAIGKSSDGMTDPPGSTILGGEAAVTNLTVEQQIDLLRPGVRIGLARRLHVWMMALAAVLGLVGLVVWNPIPIMIGAFLGIVGFAERRAGPNLDAAVRAFDEDAPTRGHASITIVSGDLDDHYHVLLREESRPDSEYEFIPQGWRPVAGSYGAQIWRDRVTGVPVLATVEHGVLIPRGRV